MAAGAAETTDRILGALEAAFLPLEAHTSMQENGNVQLRILDGTEAVLIDERPLYGTHTGQVARDWIADTRKRLEGMGFQLDPRKEPAEEG